MFPAHTYMLDSKKGGVKRVLDHTLPTAMVFTMNATEAQFKQHHYDVVLCNNDACLLAGKGKIKLFSWFHQR